MDERIVIAAAVAWCCPEGCAYVEAGRPAECGAMMGDEWLHGKVRAMLKAAEASASAAALPNGKSSHAGTVPSTRAGLCLDQQSTPTRGRGKDMGVTLIVTTPRGREIVLDPGWRSMMNQLLIENGLMGELDKADIDCLRAVADKQLKGERDPPFDYSDQIKNAFGVIVETIEKYGSATVSAHW